MLHMESLQQMLLELNSWSEDQETAPASALPEIMRLALSAPYLMHQLLACGALQLSILKPEQRQSYHYHATCLQNFALNNFTNHTSRLEGLDSITAFLFAALLGLHMLCDTLVFREGSFETFLGRFVQYVRLHSGVRTIAAEGRWNRIREFVTRPFPRFSPQLGPMDAVPGPVCKALIDRVVDSELDEEDQKALLQAIQALQHWKQGRGWSSHAKTCQVGY